MPNIYRDLEITRQIIELIRTAQNQIIITSPKIEFWQQLNDEIDLVVKKHIQVIIITEDNSEININTLSRLLGVGAIIRMVPNLTTAIYYNENVGLISSMNLQNPFNANFKDFAIKIIDTDSILDIYKYLNDLIISSKLFVNSDVIESDIPGFCIRCGDFITFDPNTPLCKDCLIESTDHQREDQNEKYCHKCGETFIQEWEIFTFKSPMCNVCL
jgi:hypothetical protein